MKKRSTQQKILILDVISSFGTFFTADDLFSEVSKKNDKIGIATVYRMLSELKRQDKIHTYICDRKTLYAMNKTNHCHFICNDCGKTDHISIEKIDFLKKDIPGKVCHFQIDIYGICGKCEAKKEKKQIMP